MAAIRSIEEIKEKWEQVTPARAPQYEIGIRKPLRDWATNAAKQAGAWADGVQAAITDNRFEKGVKAAGQAKWQSGALEKGVKMGRWREGIGIAADEYAKGFGPFRDVIEATTLPPRRAKGDPDNIERVRIMADVLHKKKLEKYR